MYLMTCMILFMPEWIQQYRESFIQPDKLQQIVDLFMKDYDNKKEEVRVGPQTSPTSCDPTTLLQLRFVFCHRKRSGRGRRLRRKKRMKRAGWRSQEDTRAPRPALTVRRPTRRLYRKRWGRRKGRSSWTSTPGSIETHRKNVRWHFYKY